MKKLSFIYILFISLNCFAQNDCNDGIIICGNTGFTGLSVSGFGTQELTSSNACDSNENNSIWLKISINTGGTLGFVLTPESSSINEDFDFWVFGPNVTCGAIGTSIRCSTTNPDASGQSDNLTGMNDTESDTFEGPGASGNSFVKSLTVNAGETYFLVIDRPVGNSNFSIEWTGTATFNSPPVLNIPTTTNGLNLTSCDLDGVFDNSTTFDLTQNSAIIVGTQTGVAVTYYETSNDAIAGINEIANPSTFMNTTNPQKVYCRITNTTTKCFTYSDFEVLVNNTVSIPGSEYSKCDDANDGNDSNGKVDFNLTNVTNKIFTGVDLTGFTINYYLTQNEADTDTNPLVATFSNTIASQQDIFVKAYNASGCSGTKKITLKVNPLPNKISASLTQCDIDATADGLTTFNLKQADSSFLTSANYSVAYYLNNTTFTNNLPIADTFTNTTNPQTIIAAVTDTTTGCVRLNNLILNANVIPIQNINTLKSCDILGVENGMSKFDLSLANITISASQTISYYVTETDALTETNAISNTTAYQNTTAYIDTVFARIEDNNSCSRIIKIPLEVVKLPKILTTDKDYILCKNITGDAIQLYAGIIEGLETDFTYKWFLNNVQLQLFTASISATQTGTYTVEVYNADNCFRTRTIKVKESSTATIQNIDIQDLTIDKNTVTINLTPSNNVYNFSIDEPNGPFQNSNIFTNITSGFHTVYIQDTNGCGIVSKEIGVVGFPNYFTPNGDSYNDIWRVDGQNKVFNPDTKVSIFDRFGKLIKDIPVRNTNGWDGTLNGKQMPADDYWYVVTLSNGTICKGHFALKR